MFALRSVNGKPACFWSMLRLNRRMEVFLTASFVSEISTSFFLFSAGTGHLRVIWRLESCRTGCRLQKWTVFVLLLKRLFIHFSVHTEVDATARFGPFSLCTCVHFSPVKQNNRAKFERLDEKKMSRMFCRTIKLLWKSPRDKHCAVHKISAACSLPNTINHEAFYWWWLLMIDTPLREAELCTTCAALSCSSYQIFMRNKQRNEE